MVNKFTLTRVDLKDLRKLRRLAKKDRRSVADIVRHAFRIYFKLFDS